MKYKCNSHVRECQCEPTLNQKMYVRIIAATILRRPLMGTRRFFRNQMPSVHCNNGSSSVASQSTA
jgi:hypothetical protein